MKIPKEFDGQLLTERYVTRQYCYTFLADLKWSEGYSCKRCYVIIYIKGKQPCSRRCSKCACDESTTTGILFHKLKFEILEASEE